MSLHFTWCPAKIIRQPVFGSNITNADWAGEGEEAVERREHVWEGCRKRRGEESWQETYRRILGK